MTFRPRYVTVDCHGTPIDFQIHTLARMPLFLTDFGAYRLDEVMSSWKPYAEVIKTPLRRCCPRWSVPDRDASR